MKHGVTALADPRFPRMVNQLKSNPELAKVLKSNPTWLTSLSCSQRAHVHNASCSTDNCSANWAGWEDYWAGPNQEFNSVYMSWRVPPVPTAPTSQPEWNSVWPGIGSGESANDLLVQLGTNNASGSAGGDYYGANFWYELYPMQDEQVIDNMSIHTNDLVTAQTLWSGPNQGGTASFIICDVTTSVCVYPEETPTAPYSFSGYQAEWIVERPTFDNEYTALQPFSTINITDASGTTITPTGSETSYNLGSGAGAENSYPMDMSNCAYTQVLASPGAVSSAGDFSVTYHATGTAENCG